MKFGSISIRVLLSGIIGLMGLAIIALTANAALQQYHRYDAALRVVTLSHIDKALFEAVQAIRFERGAMNLVLSVPPEQNARLLESSLSNRRTVDGGLARAFAGLGSVDIPGLTAAADKLKADYAFIKTLREEADRMVKLPLDARDKAFKEGFMPGTGRLQPSIEAVLSILETEMRRLAPSTSDLILVRAMGWTVRVGVGMDNLSFNAAIAGHRSFTPAEQALFKVRQGRVETAWGFVRSIAEGAKAPPELRTAFERAQAGYFAGPFAELMAKVSDAISNHRDPGVTIDGWREKSIPAQALVGRVPIVAMDLLARQSENAAARAWVEALGLVAVLAGAIALVVGGLMIALFRVARPITAMTDAMRRLAADDLGSEIPCLGRGDEVGGMAAAVQVFKDSMIRNHALEAEQRAGEARAAEEKRQAEERALADKRAAEGKAAADRKAAMRELAAEFEGAVGNIVEMVSQASTKLEAAASSLSQTAQTTQQLSATVATASQQATDNVQSVASAAEQMTGSVQEISRQVHESSRIASEAVKQAEKTDTRIAELSHAASRIGDVVKLITAVAEQTNLLALNATIEAARAGDAGRGFAVVAQEVKALAAQTAKATDEIATQIAGMQAATQESVAAIKEIGGTISRISEIAEGIAAAVEQQGAATQEISRNVQEASKGTAQVMSNIISVERGAGETGSASSEVLASARSLSSESGHLKSEVQKFLATVRAA